MDFNAYYKDDNITIYCDDHDRGMLALKSIPDNSVDSIVTDPPSGTGFMNADWDKNKGGRDRWIAWLTPIMEEAYRILKPGGHAFIWAFPRTSHWTATAVENAGFYVSDKTYHAFSQGFPKSMNISKQIDKRAGGEREIIGINKKAQRTNCEKNHTSGQVGNFGLKAEHSGTITAPATDDAKKWEGWGTAQKPAIEEWILARKPISEKTIVDNVLKWGTGAINIDVGRVDSYLPGEFEKLVQRTKTPRNVIKGGKFHAGAGELEQEIIGTSMTPNGRFPANFVLSHSPNCNIDANECADDCPIKKLNEQSGICKSGKMKAATTRKNTKGFNGAMPKTTGSETIGDEGGASRFFKNFEPFFYIPKPSSKEKNLGLVKNRFESESGGIEVDKNDHPTVKSIVLCKYLVNLITPPGGTVLDMFMGSGSIGCAAVTDGFNYIGIDKKLDYCDKSKRRMIFWRNHII